MSGIRGGMDAYIVYFGMILTHVSLTFEDANLVLCKRTHHGVAYVSLTFNSSFILFILV